MSVKERLIDFLSYMDIGQAKFEKEASLGNSFVNNIGFSITKRSIDKIAQTYPQLSIAWLLTGQGEMLTGGSKPDVDVEKELLKKRVADLEKIVSFLEREIESTKESTPLKKVDSAK